jgi:uncharacterized protein (TIGR02246 family)
MHDEPATNAQLRLLLDERAIRYLILSAWAAIDSKDWPTYAEAFAPDGAFEIMGQRRVGRDAIVAGPARDLAKYDALQHIVTNELIRVDGDLAEGQWYAIAVHVPSAADASEHADVGLQYRFRARRDADGWRFTEVALEPKWTAGMRFDIDEPPEDA